MRTWIRGMAVGLALAGLLAPGTGRAGETTALKGRTGAANGLIEVGSKPIPFTLYDLDGKPVRLEDHVGKRAVLLAFWSFFCGPCREEIPLLDRIVKKYRDKGLEMLAINLDGPKLEKAVRRYVESNGFGFRVLWEEIDGATFKTADAYGVVGTPSVVLIGKDGTVVWTHVGREDPARIEEILRKAVEAG